MLKNLFSKSKKQVVYSPVIGNLVKLTEIEDEVFSTGMMGQGFGIIPANDEIESPVKGRVTAVFPTKHAITIKADAGFDVLLHMGLDTVELNGEPFEVFVKENQVVEVGDKLATMNLDLIQAKKKSSVVLVLLPELENKELILENPGVEVTAGLEIGNIK